MKVKTHLKAGQNTQSNTSSVTVTQSNSISVGTPPVAE
jgi:hypothetical protein